MNWTIAAVGTYLLVGTFISPGVTWGSAMIVSLGLLAWSMTGAKSDYPEGGHEDRT